MPSDNNAAAAAIQNRALTRSTQLLNGLVMGLVADGQLVDTEIHMLQTWLTENIEVTRSWPGSAISRLLNEILSDGVITAEEKGYLLTTLQGLVGSDFSETGSVTPSTEGLPFDQVDTLVLADAVFCLTGEFLYGTRNACEQLCTKVGVLTHSTVTKKVSHLVVGTHASPAWINTNHGRKIQKAMELRDAGHKIYIIPERIWIDHLSRT